MDTLPIIEITAPIWNPVDLQMSRPLSTSKRVSNCISTARRDIWSESATHLSAISPSFDCRCISALYACQILVHAAPTRTRGAAIGATLTSERHSSVTFQNLSYIPKPESQLENWSRVRETYLTGHYAARCLNSSASIALTVSGRSSTPESAAPERGLVHRYPIFESAVDTKEHVRASVYQRKFRNSSPVELKGQGRSGFDRILQRCRHPGRAVIRWSSGSHRSAYRFHERRSQQTED